MNTKNNSNITNNIDNIKNIKTDWDFSYIYKDIYDKKIDIELKNIDFLHTEFAKRYEDKKYIKNAKDLKKAIDDYSELIEKTSPIFLWYIGIQKELNAIDKDIEIRYKKLESEYTKIVQKTLFFTLNIAQIDKEKQEKYIKDKNLKIYNYFLKNIFDNSKYNLSEKEEKILIEKQQVSHDAWITFQTAYKNSQKVKHGKKEISIAEAMAIKSSLPRKERRSLHKEIMNTYKNISFVAEAELNAVIKNKNIDDTLRGYTKPYEETIYAYHNTISEIENLVKAVNSYNHISHEFYSLKTKVLNEAENSQDNFITMADINTSVEKYKKSKKEKNISLEKCIELLHNVFDNADIEFSNLFRKYYTEGHIDFFPKQGKSVGAFCSGIKGSQTKVLVNYSGSFKDIMTLAHEMGHAFHTDFSKKQIPIYQKYTISVAEVASTFFENIVIDYLIENAKTEEEKKDLLFAKIEENIGTIFSQIAYFEYEKKLHEEIKKHGYIKKEYMAELFRKCRASYLGDSVKIEDEDGYGYVYISHFRYFFYTYAYAYGQIIANALYFEYKKDKKFIEKIKKFFEAGKSMSPEDIFSSIGVDIKKPDFFKKGLKVIEKDIEKYKNMI